MDTHRLAEERSLAYHRTIAGRLERQPAILDAARRRVEGWLRAGGEAPFYATKWAEILDREIPEVAAFLVERTELAEELRQSSPFAGALPPRERWRLWRETKERLAPGP